MTEHHISELDQAADEINVRYQKALNMQDSGDKMLHEVAVKIETEVYLDDDGAQWSFRRWAGAKIELTVHAAEVRLIRYRDKIGYLSAAQQRKLEKSQSTADSGVNTHSVSIPTPTTVEYDEEEDEFELPPRPAQPATIDERPAVKAAMHALYNLSTAEWEFVKQWRNQL
jgi:hypothetical protein